MAIGWLGLVYSSRTVWEWRGWQQLLEQLLGFLLARQTWPHYTVTTLVVLLHMHGRNSLNEIKSIEKNSPEVYIYAYWYLYITLVLSWTFSLYLTEYHHFCTHVLYMCWCICNMLGVWSSGPFPRSLGEHSPCSQCNITTYDTPRLSLPLVWRRPLHSYFQLQLKTFVQFNIQQAIKVHTSVWQDF